jgi:DNA-binding transcriptional MerR regulator
MTAVSEPPVGRALTIGAVCRLLQEEFPDVSISKIRYLEDQGLLTLRRTGGGYRLFSEEDVERLRTILRLQRDEFLPLRVIREELLTPGRARRDRRRQPASRIRSRLETRTISREELLERAGVDPAFVRELEDFRILTAEDGVYPESDVDVVALCARLARYGIEPRNLSAIRSSIDRESALIETLVAPALRSRNPERRQSGLEDLEALASLTVELSQALFWRSVRGIVARA